MNDKNAQTVSTMFTSIAQRYDLTNDVLSCGMHRLWAKKTIVTLSKRKCSFEKTSCLDLCTGTGALLPLLLQKFDAVTGVDFSPGMLALAEKKFVQQENLKLLLGDALNLSFASDTFTHVTIAYGVRNFADLESGLREALRVLKPGGQLAVIEFGRPAKILQPAYDFYSAKIMPRIGGLLTGKRQPYEYLPATAKSFPYGSEFGSILKGCGYRDIAIRSFFGGIAYAYVAEKQV